MWCVMTLVRVSMPMAGEGRTVMAMAAERATRPRRMGRVPRMPRVVSQPSQGHDHEAGRTERQAKRIRIHKVTACKILRQGVQSVPERVGVLYPLCKRLTQMALPSPPGHTVAETVRGSSSPALRP